MCDFVGSLTLWSGAAIVTTPGISSAEKRRDEGDGGGVCDGERRFMEAMMSGYGRRTERDDVGLLFAGELGPHASANAEKQ